MTPAQIGLELPDRGEPHAVDWRARAIAAERLVSEADARTSDAAAHLDEIASNRGEPVAWAVIDDHGIREIEWDPAGASSTADIRARNDALSYGGKVVPLYRVADIVARAQIVELTADLVATNDGEDAANARIVALESALRAVLDADGGSAEELAAMTAARRVLDGAPVAPP